MTSWHMPMILLTSLNVRIKVLLWHAGQTAVIAAIPRYMCCPLKPCLFCPLLMNVLPKIRFLCLWTELSSDFNGLRENPWAPFFQSRMDCPVFFWKTGCAVSIRFVLLSAVHGTVWIHHFAKKFLIQEDLMMKLNPRLPEILYSNPPDRFLLILAGN